MITREELFEFSKIYALTSGGETLNLGRHCKHSEKIGIGFEKQKYKVWVLHEKHKWFKEAFLLSQCIPHCFTETDPLM